MLANARLYQAHLATIEMLNKATGNKHRFTILVQAPQDADKLAHKWSVRGYVYTVVKTRQLEQHIFTSDTPDDKTGQSIEYIKLEL